MYLVGPLQRAHEKSDLLHHRKVMLQLLQLLVEPRRPQDCFTYRRGKHKANESLME